MLELKEIERCIIKKYRKKLWTPFVKALNDYELIKDGDKIAVCISGGKDSLLLAKLFQELKKHGQLAFEVVFISMDPGFHRENKAALTNNCRQLQIPVNFFATEIFKVVQTHASKFPCYLCARMRRGSLYNKARELGCNKIALGHHFNDVIETTMLNLMYAGTFKTMLPKLKATNFAGMELIRPLILVREKDIIAYTEYCGISAMNCGCEVAAGKVASSRQQVKKLIAEYKEIFPDVDKSIFSAGANVNLEAIIGYSVNGKKHSYLEHYDDHKIINLEEE